ncbi:hypothetical protein [Hyphomicrobium sp. DY-1]|uniref:hypothetical protein n=1 Tax=Hyphomicrobium sp. DY-1 TaxID=3075650 RepID=UPI0039C0306B
MSDEIKRRPFEAITEPPKDVPHAPHIFFDGAPTGSVMNGIIGATLVAIRQVPDGDKIMTDAVVTAYLRCSVPAARELVAHLQSAITLLEQQSRMMNMQGPPSA